MTYDLKAYYVALLKRDLKLNGVDFDAVLASYLPSEDSSSGDVADITEKHGYKGFFPMKPSMKKAQRGVPTTRRCSSMSPQKWMDYLRFENISKNS